MKILILSLEAWREDNNGGNVLSNIFRDINATYAQIFCSEDMPQNNICERYYQISDSMIINNFLYGSPIGKQINLDRKVNNQLKGKKATERSLARKAIEFAKKHRLNLFYVAREILWARSKWINDSLRMFVKSFQPDLIFAPCYANCYMLHLTRYVSDLTNKPVISYISDDNYSLKQLHISPIYWIHRMALRSNMRRTFCYYKLVYTMTDEQKKYCERVFKANMKILRKFATIPTAAQSIKKQFKTRKIRIIYAGGLYLNRWKTMAYLNKVINGISIDSVDYELDIFTSSELSEKQKSKICEGNKAHIYSAVPYKELISLYGNYDIALHVESFDLKNKLAVRMSFSTKIIDCLQSGCAVMAICDHKQAGYRYLQRENAAICVSDKKELRKVLTSIAMKPDIIYEYRQKARECVIRNHQADLIQREFEQDLKSIIEKSG